MNNLFLKIATRYLLKNKLYSFINIFGLAIGVASFILIMLYVNHERSYDKFEGSEYVHRVYMDYLEGGEYVAGDANAYIVSGPTLQEKFPEIIDFVRLRRMTGLVLLHDNNVFDKNAGALADPSYFEIFDRTLEKGDAHTALNEPYSIVLSALLAEKIFGAANPIGETVKIAAGGNTNFKVTGVMSGEVKNSHINNDFLVSFKTFYTWPVFERDWKYTWNQNEYYTYLKLDQNADPASLNKKIMAFEPEGLKNERHHLEPIEDIHLNSNKPYEAETNGSANNIRLLTIIAFITILLSWMNYINLSTSKSMERAKEIGIRKVVGARRSQLILQFLVESGLLNFMAIVLAIATAYALLPAFNRFVGLDLNLNNVQTKGLLPYFSFILSGIILSASYPAFILSKYKSVTVLKGTLRTSTKGLNLRRGLIIGQFLVTIVLLTGAFLTNKQIRFLQNRPIGAELSNLVALNGQVLNRKTDSLLKQDFSTLLAELKKSPYVKDVALAQTFPGDDFSNMNSNIGVMFPDGTTDEKRVWYNYTVQPNYFDLMGMQFVAGKAFSQTTMERSNNIVINEKMARLMGISDMQGLIDETIKFWDQDWAIKGVVKDYHHFGLKSSIEPLIITHNKSIGNILVKLDESTATMAGTAVAMNQLNKTWHKVFPESTYSYTFLDQNFQRQYIEDRKFAKAFQIFTLLAILIASMGLFGLTSYTCIKRKKEIGVRKVNGATITQILSLLNIDFVKWVGFAFIIAVPIAWYAMSKWLEGFAYKTTISWWVFALAGIAALIIAMATVSWQSFRAAIANPVDALRDE
ncbi:ABC transporter permease [Kriegella aquimaris]|uniref:Putative ABC transport system permease protein n=1 Tax=Kriegella aquimaris TaxID=192904 RepID=A0A1G9LL52_9FLAO|nr:ABC transporter permease [Kriegella aquimaris]SDL62225.1 putative ABC transport system permease protein [Kriegella aquimaris]